MDIVKELLRSGRILSAERIAPPEGYEDKVLLFSLFYRSDDCKVAGFAAVPKELAEQGAEEAKASLPSLIFCRGGNRDFGLLSPLPVCFRASKGYAVFASQYRGNLGGTGREDFGGQDVHDITNLIDIALSTSFVKGRQVYLVGISRGGMMAFRACQDYGDKIRACVINSGLTDARAMYYTREQSMKDVFHELVGGGPEELPEEFDKRSAVTFADQIHVPVLIAQGTADWRVVPAQAYSMAEALKAAGKVEGIDYQLLIFEGADHGLRGTDYYRHEKAWFESHPL